ncbi:hypothetical protein SAMN05443248_1981 [Bradyrhizobium erythrophlei]|uniref:Uncharacterized protein n=1 Tax=Bradyrhizobium erythrophlei TaxID=1437360 RepID=A0A1M5KVK1_9BRAD|nr:hypothetical protein SAMN05443248_1981 [Bradyrhizobium erythrophlei]
MTRSASHSVLCLRPITGQTLRTALVEICYPTRCAHAICPHRRGEVVERSPAGTNVRLGSIASGWACTDDFRSTPENRHRHCPPACLKRAISRPVPRQLFQSKSIGELGNRRCYIFAPRYRTRVSQRSIEHDDYLIRVRFETSIRPPRQLTDLDFYDLVKVTCATSPHRCLGPLADIAPAGRGTRMPLPKCTVSLPWRPARSRLRACPGGRAPLTAPRSA